MPQEPSALRTPGLHAGQYWIADDFDAPLPTSVDSALQDNV